MDTGQDFETEYGVGFTHSRLFVASATINAKLNDHTPKRICWGLRFTGLGRSLLENEHKIKVWKALRPLSGLWEGSPCTEDARASCPGEAPV